MMKSTERHTADTQIADSIDYEISAAPRFYNFNLVCYLLYIGLITLITILLQVSRIVDNCHNNNSKAYEMRFMNILR